MTARLSGMDNFADKLADFLEAQASKVRSMTVDRLDRAIIFTSAGIVLAVLALIAVTMLCIAVFSIVAHYIGSANAYFAFGALFVIAGAIVWSKRTSKQEQTHG